MQAKIIPSLWFDGDAEDAARFYAKTFPDSKVTAVQKAPGDFPGGRKGDVLTVDFTLFGQPFNGINGGPQFHFSEAISFTVECEDQAEVDRYWKALSAVPESEQCGWVKDKFGLSWQIIPKALNRLLDPEDPAKAKRVFEAMLQMKKLDVAGLERAAAGERMVSSRPPATAKPGKR